MKKLFVEDQIQKTTFQNFNGKYFAATFNRLSIVDLSDLADQPMSTLDDNYQILFNGEIYNHQEIKNDLLKKGYQFLTNHSDTEALLYLLIDKGIEAVKLLRGQFSFVFLDKKIIQCYFLEIDLDKSHFFLL